MHVVLLSDHNVLTYFSIVFQLSINSWLEINHKHMFWASGG